MRAPATRGSQEYEDGEYQIKASTALHIISNLRFKTAGKQKPEVRNSSGF